MVKLDKDYEFPLYIFHSGKNYKAYEFFGCHRIKGDTFAFRVWAPHAKQVSVSGDFNGWDNKANVMAEISDGIYEAKIDNVKIIFCGKPQCIPDIFFRIHGTCTVYECTAFSDISIYRIKYFTL